MSDASSENVTRVVVVPPSVIAAAVVLAVLAIGLVIEPGGGPATAEAEPPQPLPSLTGGRALTAGPRGPGAALPPPAEGAIADRRARVQRELGRTAPGSALDAPIDPSRLGGADGAAGASEPPQRQAARREPAGQPAFGGGAGAGDATAGSLAFDEPVVELGRLAFNESVDHTITFHNRGDRTVTILGVRTTCGCTAVQPDVERLAPGATGTMQVTFTGSNAGRQAQFVRLITDDPEQAVYAVRLRAEVDAAAG